MARTHFADRREAGQRLAALLRPLGLRSPLVLALPRGGVPVGFEVARALGGELDLLLVRKLGAPGHPELAIGAINDVAGSAPSLNEDILRMTAAGPGYIAEETQRQRQELARRRLHYVGDGPPPAPRGRDVVVVDDGIATGMTARAALEALRESGAGRVVLAVPVAAPEAMEHLRHFADDVVAAIVPHALHAVGAFYRDFDQVSDAEVVELLHEARPGGSA